MKKHQYFASAENLYIEGHLSFDEISRQLQLSEKTVRLWADDGNWREKRRKFLEVKESLHEKLYTFTHELIDSVRRDWDEGKQVDPGRMYAVVRLVEKLEKAKQFEADRAADAAPQKTDLSGLSDEALKKIEQQMNMM